MPEVEVNITALMDVLTVLLFFLIKSFTITASTIENDENIKLPLAYQTKNVNDSVAVSLSKTELRADGKLLAVLDRKMNFDARAVADDGRTVLKLYEYLRKEIQKRNAIYSGAGDLSFLPDADIQIQAHKDLPFSTVKHLLHTVALSGYTNYQFIVKDPDS